MSAFSRNKGKRGEREIATIINQITGWEVKRRVRQHDGDSDLLGIPGWCVEVKNCSTLSIPEWWRQTVAQSEKEGGIPVLFYKKPRHGWRAMFPISTMLTMQTAAMWVDQLWTIDSSIEAWGALAREVKSKGWA